VQDHIRHDRREFTLQAVLAMLSGVTITVSGCGGGGGGGVNNDPPGSPSGGPAIEGDQHGSISDNHGHVAVITAIQLMAGNAVALDILGTATHTHRVELSSNDIQQIALGRSVSRTSSATEAHQHLVSFRTGEPPEAGY